MQSAEQCWVELVEQVKKGGRPDVLLGLEKPQENFTAEEFWQRLVVPGVGDPPLSFLPPDLSRLLERSAPAPEEDVVVLPPCMCLDTVLQPEFAIPPVQLESQKEEIGCKAGSSGLGKRKREPSPEPCSPRSTPEPSPESCSHQSSPEPILESCSSWSSPKPSPEPCSQQSSPEPILESCSSWSSPKKELIRDLCESNSSPDFIDLTQD